MENNYFTILIWFVGEKEPVFYKLPFEDFYNNKLTSDVDVVKGLTLGETADLTTMDNIPVTIFTNKIKQFSLISFRDEMDIYVKYLKNRSEISK